MKWRFSSRQLEVLLWAGAIILLGTASYRLARYELFQRCPNCLASSVAAAASTRPNTRINAEPSLAAPQIAGRLKIARLHMNVVVLEGDDDATLALGPGRIPSSAPLGGTGNSVIAGHRDMAFRSLRFIRAGDRVQFTATKTYNYIVKKIRIVKPEDVSVLQNGPSAMLTIITCYPFRYIGSAPERFVVQATLAE